MERIKKKAVYLVPIFLGILSFIAMYGIVPLDVTNDRWILAEYDELDIIQHYAGWLAMRNSDWKIPLGMASQMGIGTGTIISYTDSIPLVAIVMKLFRNVLPNTFQYFGWFTLMCFVLQSLAAYKILHYKTKSISYSCIGTLLFSFSPILMERAFRHTALGAQWLILFSIFLYMKHVEKPGKKTYLYFGILELMAIGIHPYFLPMIAMFAFVCMIMDIQKKNYMAIILCAGIQVLTYLEGCIIGVLGNGVSVSREGFGYYSMNINALINPVSCGKYTWSSFLKERPQILGNYDGFNYMGLGVLFGVLLLPVLVFTQRKQRLIIDAVKKHWILLVGCVVMTLFAISNVVTFEDKELITIPLLPFMSKICGIFRASSRMFYPVYYLVFVFIILYLWRILGSERKRCLYGIVALIVFLQILDLHNVIVEKNLGMEEKAEYHCFIEDEKLNQIAASAETVLTEDYTKKNKLLSVWAFKNKMGTYFTVANSGNYHITEDMAEQNLTFVKQTGEIDKMIIVTTNEDVARQYELFPNIEVYALDDQYFIYNKELIGE